MEHNGYSDEEINEIAEWLADLSFAQVFFLKELYEAHLAMMAREEGSMYVQ